MPMTSISARPDEPRAPDPLWTRRELVRGVGVGALGLGLADVLQLQTQARTRPTVSKGRAKSCILIFLFGGPSQSDTWDMKPQSPAEYRGEFQPIATSVPSIQICEHLPKTAKLMQHLALVRSVTMTGLSIGDHHADTYYALTGHKPDRTFFVEGINRKPHPDDWPCLGSTVAFRKPRDPELPGVVQLPARSGEITGYINPGQFAGLLGAAQEPLLVRGELDQPLALNTPQFALPADLNSDRLDGRRDLVARLDTWQKRMEQAGVALDRLSTHQRKAYALLTSVKSKKAFDLTGEPTAIRDRYGHDINGQSLLMARRLVEAGVPAVCVHWIGRRVGAGLSWDTHTDNFGQLKNVLLPAFDACYSALLTDLQERGLLDETLVLVHAEMGRTPKVGDPRNGGKGPPGRDHWIHVMPAVLAGGGIRGGQVFGASDRVAAYPADRPVGPEHIAATVYQALGIADELTIRDRLGRPLALMEEATPLPLFG
jgi:hypothetical protein